MHGGHVIELNIGRRIVEYVIQEGNLQPFLDAGFTLDWLVDKEDMSRMSIFEGHDLDAYRHILNHWAKHERVPLPEVFEKSFPLVSYRREESDWTPDELIDQAHNRIKTTMVHQIIGELGEIRYETDGVENEGAYDKALLQLKAATTRFDIPLTDLEYEIKVQAQVRRLRINEEAKQRVSALDDWALPDHLTLGDVQAATEKQDWRVDGLIGLGANIILNAQRKAGKSTMIINLIKSLREGTPFLGQFEVPKRASSIRVFDLEMPLGMSKKWLADVGLSSGDDVTYSFLAGQVSRLSVLNPRHRGLIADSIKGTDVLIIDPLGPLIAAMGLEENSNTDIRTLLNALAELKFAAGVSELIIVHHAGHNATSRSRGASVLGDWPDAVFTLQNKEPDNTWNDRLFSAFGRDVHASNLLVKMDLTTRVLTTREGKLSDTDAMYRQKIRDILGGEEMGVNQLHQLTGITKSKFTQVYRDMERDGVLESERVGQRIILRNVTRDEDAS
jgi:hypothetical protein